MMLISYARRTKKIERQPVAVAEQIRQVVIFKIERRIDAREKFVFDVFDIVHLLASPFQQLNNRTSHIGEQVNFEGFFERGEPRRRIGFFLFPA